MTRNLGTFRGELTAPPGVTHLIYPQCVGSVPLFKEETRDW